MVSLREPYMSGDTTEFMKLFFGVEFPSFIKASLSLFELSLKTSKHLSECQGVIRHSNLFYRDMDFFQICKASKEAQRNQAWCWDVHPPNNNSAKWKQLHPWRLKWNIIMEACKIIYPNGRFVGSMLIFQSLYVFFVTKIEPIRLEDLKFNWTIHFQRFDSGNKHQQTFLTPGAVAYVRCKFLGSSRYSWFLSFVIGNFMVHDIYDAYV